MAKDGWSKADVKKWLHEQGRIPAETWRGLWVYNNAGKANGSLRNYKMTFEAADKLAVRDSRLLDSQMYMLALSAWIVERCFIDNEILGAFF